MKEIYNDIKVVYLKNAYSCKGMIKLDIKDIRTSAQGYKCVKYTLSLQTPLLTQSWDFRYTTNGMILLYVFATDVRTPKAWFNVFVVKRGSKDVKMKFHRRSTE